MQSLESPGKRGWRRDCSLQFREPLLLASESARHLGPLTTEPARETTAWSFLTPAPRSATAAAFPLLRWRIGLMIKPCFETSSFSFFCRKSGRTDDVSVLLYLRFPTALNAACRFLRRCRGTPSLHSTCPVSQSQRSERKTHRAARSDYQQSHDLSARIRGFARSAPPSSVSGSQQAK